MMIQFTFSSQEYLFIYSIVESKIESNDAKKNNFNDIVKVKYFCTYANINNNVNKYTHREEGN